MLFYLFVNYQKLYVSLSNVLLLLHLLSFNIFFSNFKVRGTRTDETQSHVHRMYFMGPNTFREPWHLPYSPPDAIIDIV